MELLIEPLALFLVEVVVPFLAGVVALVVEGFVVVWQLLRALMGRSASTGGPAEVAVDVASATPAAATPASRVDVAVEPAPSAPPERIAAPSEVTTTAPTSSPTGAARWRWLAIAGVALLATLWFVDRGLLGIVADRAAATIADERGFTVEWDALDGHLLTGEVTLEGVRISRPAHPRTTVDLRIARLEVDIAVLSLLGDEPIVVERAALHGVEGTIERTGPRQPRPASRGFVVHELTLAEVDAAVGDRTGATPVGAQIRLEQLTVRPFRRASTAFDLFFHAEGDGRIDGRPFTVRQTGTGAVLTFDGLPGELVGAWIGGPLAWLESARIDLEIAYAAPAAGEDHRFGFEVHLDALRLATPTEASTRWTLVTRPLRAWLEDRDPSLTLRFESRATDAELEQRGRSPSRLFALLARSALTEALARKAGIATGVLTSIGEVVEALRR